MMKKICKIKENNSRINRKKFLSFFIMIPLAWSNFEFQCTIDGAVGTKRQCLTDEYEEVEEVGVWWKVTPHEKK